MSFPKNLFITFILATVLFLVILLLFNKMKPATQTAIPAFEVVKKPLKITGWIPYWDQEAAFKSFSDNVNLFDHIGLFWYRLDKNGEIKLYSTTKEDLSIIEFAHNNNVKVLPVIANLPDYEEGGNWDFLRVDKVIKTPQVRLKHISEIVDLIEKNNFDGITIDYEALKKSQKDNFNNFIEELSIKLHNKNKFLGIGIHPKTSENNPKENNGSWAQDYKKLALWADYLYFMTYTQHTIDSNPGPSGSFSWIEKVVNYTLIDLKLPKEKVFLGVGLFGSKWYGNDDDLTFQEVSKLIAQYNPKVTWDNQAKSSYFEYKENDTFYTVWFENAKSIKERVTLAKKLGIAGIGLWRLGGEDEEIWQILQIIKDK